MGRLNAREVTLAIALAVMGFFFTMREFVLFLNTLNPLEGLLVYYLILYVAIFALSRLDLVIFGLKIKSVLQTIGVTLVTFAFFITVDWTSPYIQYVSTGHLTGASNIFYQCEDGVMWYLWSFLFPGNVEVLRICTYVVSPFLLSLLGGMLISRRVSLAP
jgi:hypothetical protein